MENGFFISFEGIDGCGKSTQAKMLYDALKNKDITCDITNEPADNPIGKLIRTYILKEDTPKEADALLFAADRIVHCHDYVKKQINRANVVITDRYNDSSIAYQHAQGLPIDWIENINQFALIPDVTFLLDIDPTIALDRIGDRAVKKDKFEYIEFLEKVRLNFVNIAKKYPLRVMIVNGNEDEHILHERIVQYVLNKLRSS